MTFQDSEIENSTDCFCMNVFFKMYFIRTKKMNYIYAFNMRKNSKLLYGTKIYTRADSFPRTPFTCGGFTCIGGAGQKLYMQH